MTLERLHELAAAVFSGQNPFTGVDLCTPCNKQIYNVLKTDFPEVFGQGQIVTDIEAACGPAFIGKSGISSCPKLIDRNSYPS